MTIFQHIDRMKYIHHLIRTQATGEPDNFAQKLRISRRQLYNILEELKDFGAEIKYSRTHQTFYYALPFVLEIKVKMQCLDVAECETVFGGSILSLFNNNGSFRAIKLHGSLVTLQL